MQGTAHVFGDEINTDVIAPSDYYGDPTTEMVDHLFEPIRPEFTSTVSEGDFVVAGRHFGSGSSRETAPAGIQDAGVAAVIAESFSRTFYRNAIAIGLPAIVCPAIVRATTDGDVLDVDFEANTLSNVTEGASASFDDLPPEIREIFDSGGLIEHYRNHPEGLRHE